eukprot:10066908-Alexandrium_andersonii.AAC.1
MAPVALGAGAPVEVGLAVLRGPPHGLADFLVRPLGDAVCALRRRAAGATAWCGHLGVGVACPAAA